MPISHLVMSDLHLGALNSLLTNVGADGTARPGSPSPVLHALGGALGSLLADEAQPPTLVLAGDVFELALTSTGVACETFGDFASVVFSGSQPLAADDIFFTPGNHDHHLWEVARQQQYARYVAEVPRGQRLRDDWHVTHLFPEHDLLPHDDEFVTTLLRRAIGRDDLRVRQVYPNLGIRCGDRIVVVHHGHYTESMYRLMELLHKVMAPERQDSDQAWHIEADNFAWVDFFWSTMGRSGDAGTDVGALYEMLQSEEALRTLADRLVNLLVVRRPASWTQRARQRAEAWLLRRGAHLAVRRKVRFERLHPEHPLSPDAEKGLRHYLAHAVARQLADEAGGVPGEVSFVFGHTHKPLVTSMDVEGFTSPVDVVNTGGWVVDTPHDAPLHGASLVVIDDAGGVASIDIFRQGSTGPATVRGVGASAAPLVDLLTQRMHDDPAPWRALSDALTAEVPARQRQLADRISGDIATVRTHRGVSPGAAR